MRRTGKWIVIGIAGLLLLSLAGQALPQPGDRIALSRMLDLIEGGTVQRATVSASSVTVVLTDGRELRSRFPTTYGDDLIVLLRQHRISFDVGRTSSTLLPLLVLLPFVLFGVFWRWLAGRLPARAD